MTEERMQDLSDLKREGLSLANKKLQAEIEALDRGTRPEKGWALATKRVVSIGGVLALIVSVVGIWDTVAKAISERAHLLETENSARFEVAIGHLEDSKPLSKLIGVSALGGYLNQKQEEATRRKTLFALAGTVATETDPQAQTAIYDLISQLPEKALTADEWIYLQGLLVSQSRTLTSKGNLARARNFGIEGSRAESEVIARHLASVITVNVHRGFVKNFSDYSGIYCADCDFSKITFSKNTSFEGAILDRVNFKEASLVGANFDRAEILGSNFSEADLEDASFAIPSKSQVGVKEEDSDRVTVVETPALEHIAAALATEYRMFVTMPNFSCANLKGARFDGLAIFPSISFARRTLPDKNQKDKPRWYSTVPQSLLDTGEIRKNVSFTPLLIVPAKFFRANVEHAKFGKALSFAMFPKNSDDEDFSRAKSFQTAEFDLMMGVPPDDWWEFAAQTEDKPPGEDEFKDYSSDWKREARTTFRRMQGSFAESNWKAAELPETVMKAFANKPPTLGEYRYTFLRQILEGDPDMNCKTRK